MRQILLLILLFFAGSWLARKLRHAQEHAQARTGRGAGYDGASGAGGPGAARPNGDARSLPEPMVRCAECGVHAPKGEAVAAGGDYFCSAEHAQRHAARANGRDVR
ncbi:MULTISPECIES: PP0621 family protein [Burkholderia]|uniref:Pyrimidine deaminase n=2 Tax=Burkholderia TaxID=32008 RepID=A0A071MJD4_9BURK|nr:PP0621 family protein [Burkholderia seminalis]MBJ9592360.1 deaminase [Burkholderia seminalis]MCA8301730.1 deaminase [Burkholderia seminalis]MCA8421609.1 deaminase [Burkholderia seminalis]MCA8431456.1 deaminase [Burkholderia seminalis]MDN7853831.1 PP0621 family protein [Burkholderia seminalis]